MTTTFAPNQPYDSKLDIRFTDGVRPSWAAALVDGKPPHGDCHLVVLPRRGGKTWIARALVRARGIDAPTKVVDLRGAAQAAKTSGHYDVFKTGAWGEIRPAPGGMLIVDEPGSFVADGSVDHFVAGLATLRETGTVPVLFLSPGEYDQLLPHLQADSWKDRIVPPVLAAEEVQRMAARAPDWGPEVIDQVSAIDPAWLQTPFLLEVLLHTAEQHAELRAHADRLSRAAAEDAEQHQYIVQLVRNGLTAEQRTELRATRWRAAGLPLPRHTAESIVDQTTIPGDPVVERHLPKVLRIHHLSDLHFGGSLRTTVDAKDKSRAGSIIANLAGAGTPLDSYLSHVAQLKSHGHAPHLVVISGDLVDRPNDAVGEIARTWLEKLRTYLEPHPDLGPDDPRIVLVGGNHDVSWELSLDEDRHARHAWFARTFDGFPHGDLHLADPTQRRWQLRYPGAGVRLLLLGSAESGGEALSDDDRARVEQLLAAGKDETAVRDVITKIERIDPGVVSRGVLDQIGPEAGSLSIAVLHHPVSPVPAVEVAPYSGIVNAGQTKDRLARAEVSLVLHGHTHMAFLAAERILNTAPEWTMRIAGAASLAAATTDEENGYNQIFVAREGSEYRVVLRPMRLQGAGWTAQAPYGFRPGAPAESSLHELTLDATAGRSVNR